MLTRFEHGKGAKDQSVMLSPRLLALPRDPGRAVRPRYWLFPSQSEDRHLDLSVLQAAYRVARAAPDSSRRLLETRQWRCAVAGIQGI
jgi:integrase/recombinase XerD